MGIFRKKVKAETQNCTSTGPQTISINCYHFFAEPALQLINQSVPLGHPGKVLDGYVYHTCPHCRMSFRTLVFEGEGLPLVKPSPSKTRVRIEVAPLRC